MVSAADPRAAAAGVRVLRQGGSAADAALATLLALTVVEPQSSGIGGGGFLVHGDPRGAVTTYDGRETAPMAATGTWFFKDGKPLSTDDAIPGGKSVGVPGNVRMMALAHRDHGRVDWPTLFAPAIALARRRVRDHSALAPRTRRYRETGALSLDARTYSMPADARRCRPARGPQPPARALLERLAAMD